MAALLSRRLRTAASQSSFATTETCFHDIVDDYLVVRSTVEDRASLYRAKQLMYFIRAASETAFATALGEHVASLLARRGAILSDNESAGKYLSQGPCFWTRKKFLAMLSCRFADSQTLRAAELQSYSSKPLNRPKYAACYRRICAPADA